MLHQHMIVELLGIPPHRGQGRLPIGQRKPQGVVDHLLHRLNRFMRQPAARDDAAKR